VVREIVAQGQEVGNHSYWHAVNLPFLSAVALRQELEKAQQSIAVASGRRPALFRPPYGLRTPRLLMVARQLGLIPVTWDVVGRDWRERDSARIVSEILSHVRPGSIILLHDGDGLSPSPDRSATVAALGPLMEALQAQGYRLVSFSDLLQVLPDQPGSPQFETHQVSGEK
jgi:peptidoglycan/xylan/chitin deacetylase (PgdA/CDA1 family)